MASEYDIQVEFVHFPLNPDTPPEGVDLLARFGTGPEAEAKLAASQKRMKDLTAAEKLPWGKRTKNYNSRLAQELGVWAESKGRGLEYHDAVFRAYFAEGRNISDAAVLADLAAKVGLDRKEAKRVLADRSQGEALNAHWARSFAADIDLVPTFAVGDKQLRGSQDYAELEKLVVEAGARKR